MILYYRKGDKPLPIEKRFTDLDKAIEAARATKEPLVIGRLGKLRRSHRFVRRLVVAAEAGVEFSCHDDPTVTHWTIQEIEEESAAFAAQASDYARDGWVGRARTGFKPGHRPFNQRQAVKISAQKRSDRASRAYARLVPEMQRLHQEHSFDRVAALLNEAGHRTIIGTPFNGPTVCRILQRLGG